MDNIVVLDAINELGQNIDNTRTDISALDNRITNVNSNINNTSAFDHVWMITNSNSNVITSFQQKGTRGSNSHTFYTTFDGYYTFVYVPSNESYWYYDSFDKKQTVYVGNIPRTVNGIQILDIYGYGVNSNTANYKTINKQFLNLTNIRYPNQVQSKSIYLPKNSNVIITMSDSYGTGSSADDSVNMGVLNICGTLQYVNINTVPLIY